MATCLQDGIGIRHWKHTHQKKTYNSCDHSLNQPSQSLLILLVLPKFWCLLQPAKTFLDMAYPFGKWAWALLSSFWSASNSKRRALIDPVALRSAHDVQRTSPLHFHDLYWFLFISIDVWFLWYLLYIPHCFPWFCQDSSPFPAGTCFAFKRSMISCQRLGDLRVSMVVPISKIREVNKQN